MPSTPSGYRRRNSLRHPSYDYTKPGAYFVTICVHRGRSIFGQVSDQVMQLNPLGQIADAVWTEISQRNANVQIDTYVVMPNHVHVLLWLTDRQRSADESASSQERKFGRPIRGSLSTLIGVYKGSVTQQARNAGLISSARLWQRNFYDHIVRSDAEAQRIREYIQNNPRRWRGDQLHPASLPNRHNRRWR